MQWRLAQPRRGKNQEDEQAEEEADFGDMLFLTVKYGFSLHIYNVSLWEKTKVRLSGTHESVAFLLLR